MEIQHTALDLTVAASDEECTLNHSDILLEICIRSDDEVIRTMSQVSSLWSYIREFANSPFFWYRRSQHVGMSSMAFNLDRNWMKMYDFFSYLRYDSGGHTRHTLTARWIAIPQAVGQRGVVIRRRERMQSSEAAVGGDRGAGAAIDTEQ